MSNLDKIQEGIDTVRKISREIYSASINNDALVNMLNSITPENRKSLWNTYQNAAGPIKSVRKKVAEILIIRSIDVKELQDIINVAQSENPRSFSRMYRHWYNILYMFVFSNYRASVNTSINDIVSNILLALGSSGNIKSVKFDFSGERETGSTRMWIALFNASHLKQVSATQLFISIENGSVFYSLYDRPHDNHIDEERISNDQPFLASNLVSHFKEHLQFVLKDNLTSAAIKTIFLGTGENVFKVSMGPNDIDEDTYNFMLNDKLVMVHKDTKPLGQSYEKQGMVFTKTMKKGDYIYLCRGNKMILVGRISGESEAVEYGDWGGDGWVQRSFEIVAESVTDVTYSGEQKWWTPNFRSTCWQIPLEELPLANKIFFNPFFKLEFIESAEPSKSRKENDRQLMGYSINTILYGPPGTGKTFSTIRKAAEIITGKIHDTAEKYENAKQLFRYESGKQIEFITFHQNYSYEDFVAGLRPDVEGSSFGLRFTEYKGIFYRICQRATENYQQYSSGQTFIEPAFEEILEVFLQPLIDEKEIEIATIARNVSFHITGNNGKNLSFRKQGGGTQHTLSLSTLKDLYFEKRDYNLHGLAIYFRPVVDKLKQIAAGLRKETGKIALKNYVLIIDEINRANISRVFGELITLLEPDKRLGATNELRLRLPGLPEEELFSVPPNLYIIGTMNTADKSIALIDIALRRRFVFEPMYPDYNLVASPYKEFLEALNKQILEKKNADFLIGHSYLMADEGGELDFKSALNHRIIPLLNEYFYNHRSVSVFSLLEEAIKNVPGFIVVPNLYTGVECKKS